MRNKIRLLLLLSTAVLTVNGSAQRDTSATIKSIGAKVRAAGKTNAVKRHAVKAQPAVRHIAKRSPAQKTQAATATKAIPKPQVGGHNPPPVLQTPPAPPMPGPEVLIDFEELTGCSYHEATPVTEASRLSAQYAEVHGVTYGSGAGYVAVVNLGNGATSGVNGITGTSVDGRVTYRDTNPVVITFVDPTHPDRPGVTNFVSIRGDVHGNGPHVRVKLEAFDVTGKLLAEDVQEDRGGQLFTLKVQGIHTVRFSGVDEKSGGVGLDDLRFNRPVAAR